MTQKISVTFKADKSGDFIGFKKMINGLDIKPDSVSPDMQVIVGFELSARELASNISEKKRRLGY